MRKAITLLMMLPGLVLAETMYVSPQANVPLTSGPGVESSVIGRLTPGDTVTVIERESGQARIVTPYGTEGWLSETMLTAEPPATLRLRALEEELAGVRKELAETQASLRSSQASLRQAQQATSAARSAGEGRVEELQSEVVTLRQSRSVHEETIARLQQQLAEREMALEASRLLATAPATGMAAASSGLSPRNAPLLAIAALLLGGSAMWMGAYASRRRMRRRYHGINL